jgi:hypothetical protein
MLDHGDLSRIWERPASVQRVQVEQVEGLPQDNPRSELLAFRLQARRISFTADVAGGHARMLCHVSICVEKVGKKRASHRIRA